MGMSEIMDAVARLSVEEQRQLVQQIIENWSLAVNTANGSATQAQVVSSETEQPSQQSNWLQEMARMGREHTSDVWRGFSPDLVERSREILENEFADYLRSRMDDTNEPA